MILYLDTNYPQTNHFWPYQGANSEEKTGYIRRRVCFVARSLSSFTVEFRPPHDLPTNFRFLTSYSLSFLFFFLLYLHQTNAARLKYPDIAVLPSSFVVSTSPFCGSLNCSSTHFPEPYSFCSQKTTRPEMTATAVPNIQVSCNFLNVVDINVNSSPILGSCYQEYMV